MTKRHKNISKAELVILTPKPGTSIGLPNRFQLSKWQYHLSSCSNQILAFFVLCPNFLSSLRFLFKIRSCLPPPFPILLIYLFFFFNSMSWVVVKLLGLMLSLLGPGFNPWLGTDDSISLTAEPKQRKLHLPIFKIRIYIYMYIFFPSWLWIFPQCSDGKESACNVGDPGLTPGSGRSLGEGHGNPLQYSCLKNSTERRAWRATVHRVAKSLKHRSN